jgi:S-adenosylmethionine hydrolase
VFVTFLSDFGLQDDFVGTCHGVIKRIAPEAQIIDITHGIPPQQILQGALVLANTIPYMPVGAHLAVVDPGVGGARRPLALRDGEGRFYVGPDNGLLIPAAEALGGIVSVHELSSPDFRLPEVSATFHGRDVFAPAAAHLATGVPADRMGAPVDPAGVVRLPAPLCAVRDGRLDSEVVGEDAFGNVQLAAVAADLAAAGLGPGSRVRVLLDGSGFDADVVRTFADVPPGALLMHVDSAGHVALAVNRGSAAERLGAVRPGRRISLVRG